MELVNARSLRRAYLDWVEDQIDAFKESIPRADLLHLAEKVIEEQRVTHAGQYQLSELVLCDAVNRKIFRTLGLPGYRSWSGAWRRRVEAEGVILAQPAEVRQRDTLADLPPTHSAVAPTDSFTTKRAMAMV